MAQNLFDSPTSAFNSNCIRYAETATGSDYGNISYRIILVPRYRRKIFSMKESEDAFKKGAGICATERNFEIKKFLFNEDAVIMWISAPPYIAPKEIAGQLKSYTTKSLQAGVPDLAGVKSIWTKHYFAATCEAGILSHLDWKELAHEYARRQPTHG